MDEIETKAIDDMYQAAAILAYGGQLAEIDSLNPSQQRFLFKNLPIQRIVVSDEDVFLKTLDNVSIEDLVMYDLSSRLWHPPSYPTSIRKIKAVIHQNQKPRMKYADK